MPPSVGSHIPLPFVSLQTDVGFVDVTVYGEVPPVMLNDTRLTDALAPLSTVAVPGVIVKAAGGVGGTVGGTTATLVLACLPPTLAVIATEIVGPPAARVGAVNFAVAMPFVSV